MPAIRAQWASEGCAEGRRLVGRVPVSNSLESRFVKEGWVVEDGVHCDKRPGHVSDLTLTRNTFQGCGEGQSPFPEGLGVSPSSLSPSPKNGG